VTDIDQSPAMKLKSYSRRLKVRVTGSLGQTRSESGLNEPLALTTNGHLMTTRVKQLTEVKFAIHRWSAAGDWSVRRQGICPIRNPRNSCAVRSDESAQKVFATKTFC